MQLIKKTAGASSQSVSCDNVCRVAVGITRVTALSLSQAFPTLRAETTVSVAIAAQTSHAFDRLNTTIKKAESITPQKRAEPKNDNIHSGVA